MKTSIMEEERGPVLRKALVIPPKKKDNLDPNPQNSDDEDKVDDPEDDDDFTPNPSQLAMINKFTLKSMAAKDLWVVTILACDNQIDRHFERILPGALKKLAPTFIGKVALSDHDWSESVQSGRIFNSYVKTDPSVKSGIVNEAYQCVMLEIYMLRTNENATFRKEVEAGIKKETSVGFFLDWMEVKCSICNEPLWDWMGECTHMPGREYTFDGGKQVELCIGLIPEHDKLEGAENSWVAVPAQPKAGAVRAQKDAEGADLRQQLLSRKEKHLMDGKDLLDALLDPKKMAEALKGQDPAMVKKALEALKGKGKPEDDGDETDDDEDEAEDSAPQTDAQTTAAPVTEVAVKIEAKEVDWQNLVQASVENAFNNQKNFIQEIVKSQVAESVKEATAELAQKFADLDTIVNSKLAPVTTKAPLTEGFSEPVQQQTPISKSSTPVASALISAIMVDPQAQAAK